MENKYVIAKYRIGSHELIGFLSKNAKRWAVDSAGIFSSDDFYWFWDSRKWSKDTKFYYVKECIYNK